MNHYSIKDLETLSGVKAHTLRIWEQRHGILSPKRTETNIRYYDDDDLKLLLNISFLNKNGYKISSISKLSKDDISKEVLAITEKDLDFPNQIDSLIIAMIELNEVAFEKIMSSNIMRYGFEQMMRDIVYPFLKRIGILWQTGSISPAHEHFMSNLVRQKIIVAIDGQVKSPVDDSNKFLLFLPDNELHEIGLLFADYLLRSRGFPVIYLGQNVPFKELRLIYDFYKPDFLYTSIINSRPDNISAPEYIARLSAEFPESQLLICGLQIMELPVDDTPENVFLLREVDSFVNYIMKLREGKPGN